MKLIPRTRTLQFAFAVVILLTVAMTSAEVGLSSASSPVVQSGALETAPMITVTDITGKELSLAANVATERPTVVYFMASWCPICAMNWEGLNQIVPKYEGTVDFIAISIDPTDTAEVLEELAAARNFAFRTSPGNIDAMLKFKVTAQTAKFAIDKNGKIVERHDGALTAAEWDAFFAQLING